MLSAEIADQPFANLVTGSSERVVGSEVLEGSDQIRKIRLALSDTPASLHPS
jgi:hypothetical protein